MENEPNILDKLSKQSLRTAPDIDAIKASISRMSLTTMSMAHAAFGLASESGELAGAIKAHIMYGRTLDIGNIEEELGDIWWYFNLMCETLGTTPEIIIRQNIDKLKIRYPEKYSDKDANERKDKLCSVCGENIDNPPSADSLCSKSPSYEQHKNLI